MYRDKRGLCGIEPAVGVPDEFHRHRGTSGFNLRGQRSAASTRANYSPAAIANTCCNSSTDASSTVTSNCSSTKTSADNSVSSLTSSTYVASITFSATSSSYNASAITTSQEETETGCPDLARDSCSALTRPLTVCPEQLPSESPSARVQLRRDSKTTTSGYYNHTESWTRKLAPTKK
ncbi:unnamed protein product [Allacma fusca]|uniref:Uncharacterized protein n=1 Tax=Allacma fusca TaxID=39272 RepID=A0A8J2KJZ1_9HEXA|nr:unnamed protein product [Allacma fusca]